MTREFSRVHKGPAAEFTRVNCWCYSSAILFALAAGMATSASAQPYLALHVTREAPDSCLANPIAAGLPCEDFVIGTFISPGDSAVVYAYVTVEGQDSSATFSAVEFEVLYGSCYYRVPPGFLVEWMSCGVTDFPGPSDQGPSFRIVNDTMVVRTRTRTADYTRSIEWVTSIFPKCSPGNIWPQSLSSVGAGKVAPASTWGRSKALHSRS